MWARRKALTQRCKGRGWAQADQCAAAQLGSAVAYLRIGHCGQRCGAAAYEWSSSEHSARVTTQRACPLLQTASPARNRTACPSPRLLHRRPVPSRSRVVVVRRGRRLCSVCGAERRGGEGGAGAGAWLSQAVQACWCSACPGSALRQLLERRPAPGALRVALKHVYHGRYSRDAATWTSWPEASGCVVPRASLQHTQSRKQARTTSGEHFWTRMAPQPQTSFACHPFLDLVAL